MVNRFWWVLSMSFGLSVSFAGNAFAQSEPAADSLKGVMNTFAARTQALVGIDDPHNQAAQIAGFVEVGTLELSTAPLGTSTGGFAFRFDSEIGTLVRSTRSFGPAFAERSLTAGKGKFSVGLNTLIARYDSLGGYNLTNGDLQTGKNGQNLGPFSYTRLTFDLSSNTVVGFASVGVTDDLDIGVAVPWMRVTLADADIALYTSSNIDLTSGNHVRAPKTSTAGVGDIAVFGKYHLWHGSQGGLAAAFQLRLPTGDTDNLRGLGVTRTLVSAIWSRGGDVSPHVNVGYEFWSSAVPLSSEFSATPNVVAKNQLNYALGVEFQPHPRITAIVDLVGRHQLHGGQMGFQSIKVAGGSMDALLPISKGLSVVSLASGIKWNIAGNVLVVGNFLTSLLNVGLKADVVPVLGLEWAF